MKIECILKRQGGTVVELGGKTYHFKPQDDGAHVAEVADDDHADTLLAVSEAYQLYDDGAQQDDGAHVADEGEQAPAVAPKTRRKAAAVPADQPATDDQGE